MSVQDDMWSSDLSNDSMWASSLHTANDELWLSSTVVAAVAAVYKLLLHSVSKTYRVFSKSKDYILHGKEKVYRLFPRNPGS